METFFSCLKYEAVSTFQATELVHAAERIKCQECQTRDVAQKKVDSLHSSFGTQNVPVAPPNESLILIIINLEIFLSKFSLKLSRLSENKLAVFGISQPAQKCHLTKQSSTVSPSIWPIFIVKSASPINFYFINNIVDIEVGIFTIFCTLCQICSSTVKEKAQKKIETIIMTQFIDFDSKGVKRSLK